MKLDITLRHLSKDQYKSVKKTIKRLMKQHLKPQVKRFNDNLIRLHATVDKTKNDYNVLYHLHLPPKKILVAKETSDNLQYALEEAMKELERQVSKHAAKISGRESWKRKARRKRIKQYKADIASQIEESSQTKAEADIQPLLPKLEKYIQQELTFLRANGDIPDDYPTMEDIRDEALLKVQYNWEELNSNDEEVYHQLIKAVHEILTEEIINDQLHKDDISLNEPVPPDAKDQAEAMVGEEISEFYQPFEVLNIEDIIPDNSEKLPEELVANNARENVYQTLSSLPNQWRRIIILNHQEGIPVADIAKTIFPMPAEQAGQLLAFAEQFMMASLNDRGLGLINRSLLSKLLK